VICCGPFAGLQKHLENSGYIKCEVLSVRGSMAYCVRLLKDWEGLKPRGTGRGFSGGGGEGEGAQPAAASRP
jgi:hypothetical protein